MPDGMWTMMWGGILLAVLFSALVLAGLAVLVSWLVRQWRTTPQNAAMAILRERYARGEIGREDFDARRRDLDA